MFLTMLLVHIGPTADARTLSYIHYTNQVHRIMFNRFNQESGTEVKLSSEISSTT